MISYCSKTKVFLMHGKGYTYAVYVNPEGFLQHLYFGSTISGDDAAFLVARAEKVTPGGSNVSIETGYMPSELGSYARGDFREATVLITRGDGGRMSTFRYLSHEIVMGAVALPGMPCIRRADETLIITLKDDFSDAQIDVKYSVSKDSDVLVKSLTVRNTGKEAFVLDRAYSFCTDLPDTQTGYSALRLAGTWGNERNPVVTPLGEGVLRVQSTRGYSSHQMNPFLAILADGCKEEQGSCYGYHLIYSGSFALTAEVTSEKSVRVQGGINDYGFSWKLAGGEVFETPQAALCYSSCGLGGMSRAYADFFREYVADPARVYASRPIVINNWEATEFNFNRDKLFEIIDASKGLGIDTFVLDDGWFGKRNDEHSGLGDWFVNESKIEGGLRAVVDRCTQNGFRFGLWFEPEMISEDSELFRAHPDWAIHMPGKEPCRSRYQLILDLSRKEVIDHVYNAVSKILSEYDISYVKWDKNREITDNYSAALPAERQGEFVHRYTLGFYELAERLTKAFPNVFFEGCASGGGRFDGGVLYYFPQTWTSDDTDASERAKIQWGTSIAYPVSSMSCHVSACPNHQTKRITPFATRGAIASLGATGYELNIAELSEEEKQQIKEQTQNYKEIEELVLKGDLYRLINPFENSYFCEMLVSKSKEKAYVVGERFRGVPRDHDRILRLAGLDEAKNYYVRELNVTASGAALMGAGLPLPRLRDLESWTWHIEEV